MDNHTLNYLADRYPTLDLQSLRILALVAEWQGASMAEIAEELGTTHQHVQFHVSMLGRGKLGRERHGLNLLNVEYDVFDKRRRNLKLTQAGERVIKAIKPLIN
ncbi:hypothetical protein [Endozoicomonas sp. GU-1]|uniref:hypothetical protein n=1 Tax=Endozoicomonas sp. GU-1 TaxID=3009078 RepID=UPI0022B30F05|nr:hypothetical protein [Endozoicomonas sp. GU-1]WBA86497.1 hypothetical protein O3276_00100 [Endozoicomonas sp. GU-1]